MQGTLSDQEGVLMLLLLCPQEEIVREAQTMRQQAHPNVLSLHCSFVHDHQLWMVGVQLSSGACCPCLQEG